MVKKVFNTVKTKHDSLSEDELMGRPGEVREEKKMGRPPQKDIYKRTLNIKNDLWKKLRLVAFEKETTITEIVHRACYEWLGRNEK